MIRASHVCPSCGHDPAFNKCWECGWTLPEESCTTDVPPSVRDRAVPKAVRDTRTEAEVQLAIRRTAEALGYECFDLSQGRPTRQPHGIPDLYVRGHGRRVWIEVKRPIGGKVSEHQERFIAGEVANGGEAFVARSERDFIEWDAA